MVYCNHRKGNAEKRGAVLKRKTIKKHVTEIHYIVHTNWGRFRLDKGAYRDYLVGNLWISWAPGKHTIVAEIPSFAPRKKPLLSTKVREVSFIYRKYRQNRGQIRLWSSFTAVSEPNFCVSGGKRLVYKLDFFSLTKGCEKGQRDWI